SSVSLFDIFPVHLNYHERKVSDACCANCKSLTEPASIRKRSQRKKRTLGCVRFRGSKLTYDLSVYDIDRPVSLFYSCCSNLNRNPCRVQCSYSYSCWCSSPWCSRWSNTSRPGMPLQGIHTFAIRSRGRRSWCWYRKARTKRVGHNL